MLPDVEVPPVPLGKLPIDSRSQQASPQKLSSQCYRSERSETA